jgi:single-strand DNA-binding protein
MDGMTLDWLIYQPMELEGRRTTKVMERSINRVTLLGRLGQDAETKFTTGGVAVTKFGLATSRRWKSGEEWKEETDWHDCVLWRNEALSQYLTKGMRVYVEGRLQTRNYDDRDGRKVYVTEVIADQVILLGGNAGEATGATRRGAGVPASMSACDLMSDAEVAF